MPEPEVIANSLDDFYARFQALLDEADGYGIEGCVVLRDKNMLSGYTDTCTCHNMCMTDVVGLLSCVAGKVKRDYLNSEEL